jgi:hypothetical protein
VLRIIQRYFSSKKDSVEIFSAHMQEVNLKIFEIYNLFYLCFWFGPQVCTGNSTFRISGVVPWHGNVSNIILLNTHPHTAYFLNTSLTTFLFTPLAVRMRHFVSPSWTETDQPLSSVVSVYRLELSCPMYISQGGVENLHDISLHPQGKSNQNRNISAVLLNMHKILMPKWKGIFKI